MARRRRPSGFQADWHAPLIGIPAVVDGRDVVVYFTSEEDALAYAGAEGPTRALELAGAWSDLDWHELRSGLEQIRRESKPSPPLQLPDD